MGPILGSLGAILDREARHWAILGPKCQNGILGRDLRTGRPSLWDEANRPRDGDNGPPEVRAPLGNAPEGSGGPRLGRGWPLEGSRSRVLGPSGSGHSLGGGCQGPGRVWPPGEGLGEPSPGVSLPGPGRPRSLGLLSGGPRLREKLVTFLEREK